MKCRDTYNHIVSHQANQKCPFSFIGIRCPNNSGLSVRFQQGSVFEIAEISI